MKTNFNAIQNIRSNSENIDNAIDAILFKVNNKLKKLKNKEYLVDHLIASGISIELANKMVHRTP